MGSHLLRIPPTWTLALCVFLAACVWHRAESFNLDVRHPIIYENPQNATKTNSYFGFSIIMYAGEGNNSWIIVGAPKADTHVNEDLKETGAVYKCDLNTLRPCESMEIYSADTEARVGADFITYRFEGAWIGATMDLQTTNDERVVICGPRWVNVLTESTPIGNLYQVGACFWAPANSDYWSILMPLMEEGRFSKIHQSKDNNYDFDFGEAGFSLHMPMTYPEEKLNQMIFGAPGILNWRGGVVQYRDGVSFDSNPKKRSVKDSDYSEVSLPDNSPFGENDYAGYQVSSGRFFKNKELLYVTSAPRANHLKGQVMIFNLTRGKEKSKKTDYIIKSKISGEQFGEYFGASLAVGDLDNDGYDDLIVGSPLFSKSKNNYEDGKISVYLGPTLEANSPRKEQFIVGHAPGARFGSAISYLGDIDCDKFPEIAVGAPYEDEGRGVVYIMSNINSKLIIIQRLIARSIYPKLRGFGSTLVNRLADIDGNEYPDIAIGAYKSGHAAIFRSRPVIHWKINTPEFSTGRLAQDATTLVLSNVCITYYGKNVPDKIDAKRLMTLDPKHKRCHINDEYTTSKVIHLTKMKDVCENIIIKLKMHMGITDQPRASIGKNKTMLMEDFPMNVRPLNTSGLENDSNLSTNLSYNLNMLCPGIKDFINPIEIYIHYQLNEHNESDKGAEEGNFKELTKPIIINNNSTEGDIHGFCKTCPVALDSQEERYSIPFQVDCGSDEVCFADLYITGDFPYLNKSSDKGQFAFTVGSNKTLLLKLTVVNKPGAEPAYLTQINVKIGSTVTLSRMSTACHKIMPDSYSYSSNTLGYTESHDAELMNEDLNSPYSSHPSSLYLQCDISKAIRPSNHIDVSLELDMTKIHGLEQITLNATVKTASNESNPSDNSWEYSLPLHYVADLEIIGKPEEEHHPYFKENKKEIESNINFKHIYEVQKYGISPVEKVETEFHIPYAIINDIYHPITFLHIKEIELKDYQGEQNLLCQKEKTDLLLNDPEHIKSTKKYNSKTSKIDSYLPKLLAKGYHTSQAANQLASNRTVYLNCSDSSNNGLKIACMKVYCFVGPFDNSQIAAKVQISMELDVKSLQHLMGVKDIITLETLGIVMPYKPHNLEQPKDGKFDIAGTSTIFIGDIPPKKVEIWWIILAVILGVILLILLGIGLYKAGFFERKKKDELDEMKKEIVPEPSNEGDTPAGD